MYRRVRIVKEVLKLENVTGEELYDALQFAKGKYKFIEANGKKYKVMPEEDPLFWKQV